MILSELGRKSAHIYGVIHYELSRTSAPGDGIWCKGFTSLSLQSVQPFKYKISVNFSELERRPGRFCWLTSSWGNQIQLKKALLVTSRQKALSHGTTPAGISRRNPFYEPMDTYEKHTEMSHPCALAHLPEGHNLYLKRAGKEQGSCTPLHHKIWA